MFDIKPIAAILSSDSRTVLFHKTSAARAMVCLTALTVCCQGWTQSSSPQPVGQLSDASKLIVERARAQMLAMKLDGTGFEAPKASLASSANGGCNMQLGSSAASLPGAKGLLAGQSTTFVFGTTLCLVH